MEMLGTKDKLFHETDEIEIIEFGVGEIAFGIHVLQVREVINAVKVNPSPHSHEYVEGIFQLRDEVLPVVDLAKALNLPPSPTPEMDKFIITELNRLKVAFHVHSVSRIYRITKDQVEEPSQLSRGLENSTIGIIKLDGRLILLIDFEKIVAEVAPSIT